MAQEVKAQVDFDEDVGALDFTKLTRDDEDNEDVKDNWDDESEDETSKIPASNSGAAPDPSADSKPKKKSAKQIAAEKEAMKKREQEMIRLQLQESSKLQTPEEAAAEKRRILKAQEDSDFALMADTFLDSSDGVSTGTGPIDSFEPTSLDKFDIFRKMLTDKITKYDKSEFYPGFLNSLFQDLALHLPSEDVRRFGATLTTLAGEKAKHDKEKTKGKTKVAVKKKAVIAGARKTDDTMANYEDDYDAVDDFF